MFTDIKKDDFGIECKANLDIFETDCKVIIDIDLDIEYAEKCIEMINNLPDKTVDNICRGLRIYCLTRVSQNRDLLSKLDFDITSKTNLRDILKSVKPLNIFIDAPEDEGLALKLEFECVWENGEAEMLFRDNDILYIGSPTELSAWDEYDLFDEDENNFINKL